MSEIEFKEKLIEEINFYRKHSVEELKKMDLGDSKIKFKKDKYDSIPEEKIEQYVNLSWTLYLKEKEISRNRFKSLGDGKLLMNCVDEVEDFGVEDYKFKQKFKQKIKNTVLEFGVVILSADCLAAILSLVLQSPNLFASAAVSSIALFAFFVIKELFASGIKPMLSKKEAIEYLKEAGIYDKLLVKMNIEKELEEIEFGGKKR